MRSFWVPLALALAVAGCVGGTGGEFVFPPIGADGKADDWTPSLNWESSDSGGAQAVFNDVFQDVSEEPVVAPFSIEANSPVLVSISAEVSAGVPHVFVRRAPSGEVVATGHGNGGRTAQAQFTQPEGEYGSSVSYQLALFVEGAEGGSFTVTLVRDIPCYENDDYEPNDSAQDAYAASPELYGAKVCNSLDGVLDPDYYGINVVAGEIAEIAMIHVERWGPLSLTVDGPNGSAQVTSEADGIRRATQEVTSDGVLLVGVTGDQAWNYYQLSLCVDDRLERMSHPDNNDSPENAARLEPGHYSMLSLCSYELWDPSGGMLGERLAFEQADTDHYAVDVAAYSLLRVLITHREGGEVTFAGPAAMDWTGPGVYEYVATADETVTFSMGTAERSNYLNSVIRDSGGYAAYDLDIIVE